jgi:hypothetical protein
MPFEPSKLPTQPLELVSDADLVVEYILCWIGDAEVQMQGASGVVGPQRFELVSELVRTHVRFPWYYWFFQRGISKTMVRMVYGAIARNLPPESRSRGQVKI